MSLFQCTVLLDTDERKNPHISGEKTGVVLKPGETWVSSEYRAADNNGFGMWVKTASGNWTAASYPRSDNTVKVYVRVQEIDPEPPSLPVVAVLVDMYPEGKRVVITSDFDMGDWIVVANGRTFVPPADG